MCLQYHRFALFLQMLLYKYSILASVSDCNQPNNHRYQETPIYFFLYQKQTKGSHYRLIRHSLLKHLVRVNFLHPNNLNGFQNQQDHLIHD